MCLVGGGLLPRRGEKGNLIALDFRRGYGIILTAHRCATAVTTTSHLAASPVGLFISGVKTGVEDGRSSTEQLQLRRMSPPGTGRRWRAQRT